MTTAVEPIKVDLPLPASANAATVAGTCAAQSAPLKQCPAYATTPAVQTAVVGMDAAVTALQGTVSKLVALEAEVSALKTTRTVETSEFTAPVGVTVVTRGRVTSASRVKESVAVTALPARSRTPAAVTV